MNERLRRLAQRISDELNDLERVVGRAQEGWHRTQQSADDLYLDGVVWDLHSFLYNAHWQEEVIRVHSTNFCR